MNTGAEFDPYEDAPDPRLYWHPRIESVLWCFDWALLAFGASLAWQFFSTPKALWKGQSGNLQAAAIGAHAIWLTTALMFLGVAVFVVEIWYQIAVQRVAAEYGVVFRRRLIAMLSLPLIAVLAPLGWFAAWTLGTIWTHLVAPLAPTEITAISAPLDLTLPQTILWFAVVIALFGVLSWCLLLIGRVCVSHYAAALHHYGLRRLIKGVLAMVLMRAKAPRKDFFMQMPVVNNVFWLIIASALYSIIPIPGANLVAAALLIACSATYSLDLIAPPTWLFLGASSYESAFVFHDLRRRWMPRLGVTLLDRDNPAWSAQYRYEAQQLLLQGIFHAKILNNPSAPRMWSLRTRDNVWRHAALVLMDFVVVIVIDARIVRDGLQEELEWLFRYGHTKKTWILGTDDRTAPAIPFALANELNAEAMSAMLMERTVSGHKLYDAEWAISGLIFPAA